MAGVTIREVVKDFGSARALDHVSLTVADGEFVALLGPSGCGKTTLLRCIAGLEKPGSGEILIGEERVFAPGVTVPPEKRHAGMVFQSYAIWPHMTVFENVAYGLQLKAMSKAEIHKRVSATLGLLGLDGFESRNSFALSGGQQQRVAVARSIVLEPQILLFDEPLSNLDAKLREQMRIELRALQKSLGTTSIFVTHDQAEAMAISDRIVVMSRGSIVQEGTPASLYFQPKNDFVANFVGVTNNLYGRVTRTSGPLATVTTDKGWSVQCNLPDDVKSGDSIALVVRPECITWSISPCASEDNCWEAIVRESVFVGSTVETEVEVAGHKLRVLSFSYNAGEFISADSVGRKIFIKIAPSSFIHIPGN